MITLTLNVFLTKFCKRLYIPTRILAPPILRTLEKTERTLEKTEQLLDETERTLWKTERTLDETEHTLEKTFCTLARASAFSCKFFTRSLLIF